MDCYHAVVSLVIVTGRKRKRDLVAVRCSHCLETVPVESYEDWAADIVKPGERYREKRL